LVQLLKSIPRWPWTAIFGAAGTVVTAVATVFLVAVTERYVELTNDLVLQGKQPSLEANTPEAIALGENPQVSVGYSNSGGPARDVVLSFALVSTDASASAIDTERARFHRWTTPGLVIGKDRRRDAHFPAESIIHWLKPAAEDAAKRIYAEACLEFRPVGMRSGALDRAFGYYAWQAKRRQWTEILDRTEAEIVARTLRALHVGTSCSDQLLYGKQEIAPASP